VTVATCLFLAWLLAITLVSAWAGWQVGAGADMDVALTPVVPRTPVPDAAGPDPPPVPSAGADPASPGPPGAFDTPVRVPSIFIDAGHDARATGNTAPVPRSSQEPAGDTPVAEATGIPAPPAGGQAAVPASEIALTSAPPTETPTETPTVAAAGTTPTDDPPVPTATEPIPAGSEDACPTGNESADDEQRESRTSAEHDSENVDEDSVDQPHPDDRDDDEWYDESTDDED
jgi:hypothetical protein